MIVSFLRLDACSLILEPWSAGLVPSCLKLEAFEKALAAGNVGPGQILVVRYKIMGEIPVFNSFHFYISSFCVSNL